MNILDKIIETKFRELKQARNILPEELIREQARQCRRNVISFSSALENSTTGIISEFKRRSPSKGWINRDADPCEIVPGYESSGAAAISVLTDNNYFGGTLDDLSAVRPLTGLPVLRKDFIVDPYQIYEARLTGADVILLIASALQVEKTIELARCARELGLEVLLELHGKEELGHINKYINAVGVNNRNLKTFNTDTSISLKMADYIPEGLIKISESGISDVTTVLDLRKAGYKGFLMGENFMRTEDPALALNDFIKQLEP